MRKMLGFAVVAAFLAAGTARAQGPTGFSLGLRLGYGIPMGDVHAGNASLGIASYKLSDLVDGQVPLQVEAMYRFDPSWSLGLYFQYGFAFVSDVYCPAGTGVSCSARDVRFGAQVHYRFPSQGFVPWVGLGFGGEWGTVTAEFMGFSGDVAEVSGFEFVNLQIGGDWLLSPAFRLGPYIQFSLAQYSTVKELGVSGTLESLPVDKSTHEWLQFGLKGTFDL